MELPLQHMEAQFGKVIEITELCPDVYFLMAKKEGDLSAHEFYIVSEDYQGSVLSKAILTYGTDFHSFRLYENESCTDSRSGYMLIDYEMALDQFRNGTLPRKELYTLARIAAADYPDYFGRIIPPQVTPCGMTLRHITIANGVFFVQTGQAWLLAVAEPVWRNSMSEFLVEWGDICTYPCLMSAEDNTPYYRFYRRNQFPAVLFELLDDEVYCSDIQRVITCREDLTAALHDYPEYVKYWNHQAQKYGKKNYMVQLHPISASAAAGKEYLALPI